LCASLLHSCLLAFNLDLSVSYASIDNTKVVEKEGFVCFPQFLTIMLNFGEDNLLCCVTT